MSESTKCGQQLVKQMSQDEGDPKLHQLVDDDPPYIQKTGLTGWKIPQKIQIFRRKIVLKRKSYQICDVLTKGQQAYSKTKVS